MKQTVKYIAMVAVLGLAACSSTNKDGEGAFGEAVDVGNLNGESVQIYDVEQGQVFEEVQLEGPEPGTQTDLVVNVGDRIFFGYDSFDLNEEARRQLELQAEWLKQYSYTTVTVEGHADERGTREYNLALGDKRATAVKNYLIALGVPVSRVAVISYGKEQPEALGSNPQGWAQNRRAITIVD